MAIGLDNKKFPIIFTQEGSHTLIADTLIADMFLNIAMAIPQPELNNMKDIESHSSSSS